MSPSRPSPKKHHGFHLRLKDVSDLDMLEAINDHAGRGGWATAQEIGKTFGISEEYAARVCSARFQWMKRWGWIEFREEKGHGHWRVTRLGNSLIDGNLPSDFEKVVKAMSDADRMRLTRVLSQQAGGTRMGVRTMFRREWQRNAVLNAR